MILKQLRRNYHEAICAQVLGYRSDILNIADKSSKRSCELANGLLTQLNLPPCPTPPSGQRAGALFEMLTMQYLEQSFALLGHIRPGQWKFSVHGEITAFAQYEHLADLASVLGHYPNLRAALGDYLITPDIVVERHPVSDSEINLTQELVDKETAILTPLRAANRQTPSPILHASISCKWTIRSDRSQNARTEGLNLIRNRKGPTPHIALVTAEPLPSRIASVALGTGDLDCIYHLALYELGQAVEAIGDETLCEVYRLLVDGKRLRDISDLPLDLAI